MYTLQFVHDRGGKKASQSPLRMYKILFDFQTITFNIWSNLVANR